ncbi:MAG: flotillin family protein [Planctomycetes bacterium]|nr:flotillin family protein [Planctomycetota bacterium]
MSPIIPVFAAFDPTVIMPLVVLALIIFFVFAFIATRFKRCPSNRILVIFGKVGRNKSSRCIHGGGAFIIPLIQDYAYLDLVPLTIEIDLVGALSKKNIRVNVPSTFTVGISTRPEIMQNAAERLLGLGDKEIRNQAADIILGQMRLVIATLSIEEINQDREKFLELVNVNVGAELQKIGLEMINVNIRDITDASGYIEAIGRKAAAEAVNQAKVEVAQADKVGLTGESMQVREREVRVAEERARSVEGQKAAERDQRVAIAKMEAEAMTGEAAANREREVRVAEETARSAEGQKAAERDRRVALASMESEAITGENSARATIAQVNADLAQKEATARQSAEVARANAERDIFAAQKAQELARLAKEQIAQEEIERQKIEIEADARAEQIRRIAAGEADAILARRSAEAEGQRRILAAKAEGYRELVAACGDRPELAPTLLMIEKIEQVVAEQVKAIQNLKIDKITVWDSGGKNGGGSTTAGFLSGLMGSLPAMHDLAAQAGIKLPEYLGRLGEDETDDERLIEASPTAADDGAKRSAPRTEPDELGRRQRPPKS